MNSLILQILSDLKTDHSLILNQIISKNKDLINDMHKMMLKAISSFNVGTSEDIEMVKFLILLGINVNYIDSETGSTYLMYACQSNYRKTIELLLLNGADTRIKNNRGLTALCYLYRVISGDDDFDIIDKLTDYEQQIIKKEQLEKLKEEQPTEKQSTNNEIINSSNNVLLTFAEQIYEANVKANENKKQSTNNEIINSSNKIPLTFAEKMKKAKEKSDEYIKQQAITKGKKTYGLIYDELADMYFYDNDNDNDKNIIHKILQAVEQGLTTYKHEFKYYYFESETTEQSKNGYSTKGQFNNEFRTSHLSAINGFLAHMHKTGKLDKNINFNVINEIHREPYCNAYNKYYMVFTW